MLTEPKQKLLNEFVERLKFAAGANLESLVLYGSGADSEPASPLSDINVLCVLRDATAPSLRKLAADIQWWAVRKQPKPMIFTAEEMQRSADVFAIEFSDIKHRHKVIHGVDYISELDVPMDLHRVQVERELRTNLIRLRDQYLTVALDLDKQLDLMVGSISSFLTLFRHSLIAIGEQSPASKEAVIDAVAKRFGFDAKPFHRILALKYDAKAERPNDVAAVFAAYLAGVCKVTEEVDRHLT